MSSPPTTCSTTHPMGASRTRRRRSRSLSAQRRRRQSYYEALADTSTTASSRTVRGPDDDFDEVIGALRRKVYTDLPNKIIYPLNTAILVLSTSSLDKARETYLEHCNEKMPQEINGSIDLAKEILGRVTPIINELRGESRRNKRLKISFERKIQEWEKKYEIACRRRRDAEQRKGQIVEQVRRIYNDHLPKKIKPSDQERFPRVHGDTNTTNPS
ncbi:uncharacterized protein FOMMEDRAFT_157808 [Fomitiporia mediterranea MF3/22]|uniref:uncharacterized protein n=1 Tax=Fomitiporia mediterranea (strain MF3/22) TaxID=694068 RepID=UPI00044092DA|nr:uncharacterized protein FOMMEDRAFT_157808 [Fomitiporia mediterranea MF3/22]EJD00711.1 hypothetical protein FOMMEDRAFT_157808 [Fomitiporia mediterranea MF3/22]